MLYKKNIKPNETDKKKKDVHFEVSEKVDGNRKIPKNFLSFAKKAFFSKKT